MSLDLVVAPLSAVHLARRKRVDSLSVSLVVEVFSFVEGPVLPHLFSESSLLSAFPVALVGTAIVLEQLTIAFHEVVIPVAWR